jgi:hypothetical protein
MPVKKLKALVLPPSPYSFEETVARVLKAKPPKKAATPKKSAWVDPDDAPEWTDEMFAKAWVFKDGKVIRKGEGPNPYARALKAKPPKKAAKRPKPSGR